MSKKHPIIAVTGSSGAGTSSVKSAFKYIFHKQNITPVIIEGDSFHRYNRKDRNEKVEIAQLEKRNFSHFGFETDRLKDLENTFISYAENGHFNRRHYPHTKQQAELYKQKTGEFIDWEDTRKISGLMLYEGLHGALIDNKHDINIAQLEDLKVGVVPIVNLEWIQKIHSDTAKRGHQEEDVTNTLLRRIRDYVNVITPQFSNTDINFQRVPLMDTSNPFISRDIPTRDESMVIIRFSDSVFSSVDYPYLLSMIKDSFMSRRNALVVLGGKMRLAMEIILHPIIKNLLTNNSSITRAMN